jgi:hypothetical protein
MEMAPGAAHISAARHFARLPCRLLRRRDALALRWEWLDGDARGSERPASDSDEDPICVAFLSAGDADKLVRAGDGELHRESRRARMSHKRGKTAAVARREERLG